MTTLATERISLLLLDCSLLSQESEARAELPLGPQNKETFPTGAALAFSATRQLVDNEQSVPPSPLLFLLSPDGELLSFYTTNRAAGAPQLCKPPEPLGAAGERKGSVVLPAAGAPKVPAAPAAIPQMSKVAEAAKAPMPFSFGGGLGGGFAASTPLKPQLQQQQQQPKATSPFVNTTAPAQKPFASIASEETPAAALKPPAAAAPTPVPAPPTTAMKPPAFTPSAPAVVGGGGGGSRGYSSASYQHAVDEEVKSFQRELDQFKARAAALSVDVGSGEEKARLKGSAEAMERFGADLGEITASQQREVAQLQNDTLEIFHWTEEARSREVRTRDPRYQRLLKNRSLDPLSQKKLSAVQSKYLFLEQQVEEVNQALDIEWKEHVRKTKGGGGGRRGGVQPPARETLYKALLTNHRILEGQKASLEKLAEQIKELKVKNITSPWHTAEAFSGSRAAAEDSAEMSRLTESFFEKTAIDASGAPSGRPGGSGRRAAVQTSPIKSFSTPEKESALRGALLSKGTVRVKPVKPQSPNQSRFLKEEDAPAQSVSKVLLDKNAKSTAAMPPLMQGILQIFDRGC